MFIVFSGLKFIYCKIFSSPYLPPSLLHSVPIRGADIVAMATLEVVPGTPLTFEWNGMKLHIPANTLEQGTSTQIMTIQASLSGQYQLPDDTELVSGIYWVAFPQRFSRPVTMELQHCAYLEHPDQFSSLFFLTAKCNQKTLPYQFQPLPGGVFSTNTSYGAIELSHFSGMGVAMRKRKRKHYTGHIFYIPQATITTWLMHFTIVCDLELCLKVCAYSYTYCMVELSYLSSISAPGSGKVLLRQRSRAWSIFGSDF